MPATNDSLRITQTGNKLTLTVEILERPYLSSGGKMYMVYSTGGYIDGSSVGLPQDSMLRVMVNLGFKKQPYLDAKRAEAERT